MTTKVRNKGKIIQVERGVGKKQGTFRKVYAHDYSRIDIASGHREDAVGAGAVNGAATAGAGA